MYQSETAPWLEFHAWNTDGSAKTDLAYNTAGISLVVKRDNLADSSALSLSAASGPTDWASGKLHRMSGNKYRVGIATSYISSFTGKIACGGSYTGGDCSGTTEVVSAYNPSANPLSTLGTNAPADWINAAAIASSALSIAKFAADIGTTAYASNPLAKAIWERLLSAMTTAGSAGKKLSDQANADVSAVALQATLNAVGVLATGIDAKTSQLTFTTPGKVDAAAELDSAARVKLAADQPDYAPALEPELRGGLTLAESVDLLIAGIAGESSQPDSDTEKFKFVDGDDAFTTTFDTSGNRASVVLH